MIIHKPLLLSKPTRFHPYPLSNTFRAASTTFLTSLPPFSTTFSIAAPAFFNSSGRAVFPNCIARNFFCCFARASLITIPAFSPAFAASATAAFLESAVGGGIFTTSNSGLVPVGSGCGVRERVEAWMADVMGLT